jgi:hypothetical protein
MHSLQCCCSRPSSFAGSRVTVFLIRGGISAAAFTVRIVGPLLLRGRAYLGE